MSRLDYDKILSDLSIMGDVAKGLQSAGLSEQAIIVLLKDKTGLSKETLQKVIREIGQLSLWALAQRPEKKPQ